MAGGGKTSAESKREYDSFDDVIEFIKMGGAKDNFFLNHKVRGFWNKVYCWASDQPEKNNTQIIKREYRVVSVKPDEIKTAYQKTLKTTYVFQTVKQPGFFELLNQWYGEADSRAQGLAFILFFQVGAKAWNAFLFNPHKGILLYSQVAGSLIVGAVTRAPSLWRNLQASFESLPSRDQVARLSFGNQVGYYTVMGNLGICALFVVLAAYVNGNAFKDFFSEETQNNYLVIGAASKTWGVLSAIGTGGGFFAFVISMTLHKLRNLLEKIESSDVRWYEWLSWQRALIIFCVIPPGVLAFAGISYEYVFDFFKDLGLENFSKIVYFGLVSFGATIVNISASRGVQTEEFLRTLKPKEPEKGGNICVNFFRAPLVLAYKLIVGIPKNIFDFYRKNPFSKSTFVFFVISWISMVLELSNQTDGVIYGLEELADKFSFIDNMLMPLIYSCSSSYDLSHFVFTFLNPIKDAHLKLSGVVTKTKEETHLINRDDTSSSEKKSCCTRITSLLGSLFSSCRKTGTQDEEEKLLEDVAKLEGGKGGGTFPKSNENEGERSGCCSGFLSPCVLM